MTKYETVELLRDRIEERRQHLGLTPEAFAEATGLTRGGLAPLRKGYRKQYQERLTLPVCRVLGWTPDSISRLLRGEEPVLLSPPTADQSLDAKMDWVVEQVTELVRQVSRMVTRWEIEDLPDGQSAGEHR